MDGRIHKIVENFQKHLDELESLPSSYKEWVKIRPSFQNSHHDFHLFSARKEREHTEVLSSFRTFLEKEFFFVKVKEEVRERAFVSSFKYAESKNLVDVTAYYEKYAEFITKCVIGYTQVTALVPAYNEEACIAETLESLLKQTVPFYQIIVINDCSTDRTAEVAEQYADRGVRVLTPPKNAGKSKALNYGIEHCESEFFLTIDADTILTEGCVEYMVPHMLNPKVGIVCGYVLPRNVTTLWERGRFIEYIIGQGLNKKAQARIKSVLIAAGCCSLYRTDAVREIGGYSERTITEDLDLTWTLFEKGHLVAFEPRAKCFSLEPKSLKIYLKQLDRWDRGAFQNFKIHSFKNSGRLKGLFYLYLADTIITPLLGIVFISLFPLSKFFFAASLGLLLDLLFTGILATFMRWEYKWEVWKYLPCYVVVRPLNLYAYFAAFYREYIKKDKLTVWVKGH